MFEMVLNALFASALVIYGSFFLPVYHALQALVLSLVSCFTFPTGITVHFYFLDSRDILGFKYPFYIDFALQLNLKVLAMLHLYCFLFLIILLLNSLAKYKKQKK